MHKSWCSFFKTLAAALLRLNVHKEDLDNLPYFLDQMPGTGYTPGLPGSFNNFQA